MPALTRTLATSLTVAGLLAACSDSIKPTAPASEATAPKLAVTAEAQVAIAPGTSIQAKVNASPPGTTFLLKRGRHRRQSVIPKSGNVFLGERDAAGNLLTILDGEDSVAYAFTPAPEPYPISPLPTPVAFPSNVRLKGLIIERYTPAGHMGAVLAGGPPESGGNTTGWVVEDCEIRYNATGGIRPGHKMQVLRNSIHHNGRVGMNGSGDSVLVEGNEIAYNNYQKQYDSGILSGGAKFVNTRRLVVRGNYVHHNEGNGIWTDINNIYALIERNRVMDNSGAGIFHEISYNAVIRTNTVERNGFARPSWFYGAGILIAHSPNVQVYGNRLRGNAQGIAGIQQDRPDHPSAYGPHLLKNLYVHDNTVHMSTGRTGVAQTIKNDAVYTSWNNRFRHNTYYLGTQANPFYWMNAPRTVSGWKSFGQDVTGTFNR